MPFGVVMPLIPGADTDVPARAVVTRRWYDAAKSSLPAIQAPSSRSAYVPGRHFDVITFEIKASDSIDVTCV